MPKSDEINVSLTCLECGHDFKKNFKKVVYGEVRCPECHGVDVELKDYITLAMMDGKVDSRILYER